MSDLGSQIVKIVHKIYGKGAALHEPCFAGKEWSYVKDCLDTGWVSSAGRYVDEFEKRIAAFTGIKRAVVTVNGTAALHMCLKIAGVTADDEVIIPSLTFVATANAIAYCGAHPHFVDVSEKSLGLCPTQLDAHLSRVLKTKSGKSYNKDTGRRVLAVVPVHVFGHPVDMDPLVEVCHKYGLTLIEDASESLGSFYKGKHTGSFGQMAAFSFNGNKIITTGGGGALLTNDDGIADRAKHLTTTAKVTHPWDYIHDEVGYNYRMPNINAALGCAQMDLLPQFLQEKRDIAARYQKHFDHIAGVSFLSEPNYAKSNYWLNAIVLDRGDEGLLQDILKITNVTGVMTRPIWTLLHRLPMYADCPRADLATSEDLSRRVINIPSSVGRKATP